MIQSVGKEGNFVENSHHGKCEAMSVVARVAVRVAKLVATLAALALNGALLVLSLVAICVGATPIGPLIALAVTTLASCLCAAYVLYLIAKDAGWVSCKSLSGAKASFVNEK